MNQEKSILFFCQMMDNKYTSSVYFFIWFWVILLFVFNFFMFIFSLFAKWRNNCHACGNVCFCLAFFLTVLLRISFNLISFQCLFMAGRGCLCHKFFFKSVIWRCETLFKGHCILVWIGGYNMTNSETRN